MTGCRGRGTPPVLGTGLYCVFEWHHPDQYGGYNIMSKKLTIQEVQKKIDENFEQKVSLAGPYVNRRTKILLRCEECGYEWEATPTSVLYSDYRHRCPNCGVVHKEKFQCTYCGKDVYRTPSQIAKSQTGLFYCSRECGNLHKNQLRKEAGEWDNSLNYRLRAFEVYPHKCAVCSWDEDERILEVHHIDENREHNNIENLCILCPTCHRKITLQYYKLTDDFKLEKVK